MAAGWGVLLTGLLAGYGFLFFAQERHGAITRQDISPSLPGPVLKGLGHSFLDQIIAEALFIKVAVYQGGLQREASTGNLDIMGQDFELMSELHPKMLDVYYRSETTLAYRGDTYTRLANRILEHGRAALPNQVALPFFEGFNYFHYLNDPAKAAEVLRTASNIPGSPQWIGHLASMLAAESGNIRTGLVWLREMLANSTDEKEKARYTTAIEAFEEALQVQLALERYTHTVGAAPDTLDALVPEYIARIPTFESEFVLVYKKPDLFLTRRRS
jgi:hypothetical protein